MSFPTLNVFISSTSRDLFAHRKAVQDAIMRLKYLHPVGMEHFGAQDADATEVSLTETTACDVFVGIYAYRYGYRPTGGISITEMEYREALRRNIPRLIFVVDPQSKDYDGWNDLDTNRDEEPEALKLLTDFKAELGQMRVWDTFTTPSDLAAKVATSISNWLQEHPFEGWHAPSPPSISLEKKFIGREKEISEIVAMLGLDGSTSITVCLYGTGGIGKTYLAYHLANILKDDFKGGVFHAILGPDAKDSGNVLARILPNWAQSHPQARKANSQEITPQNVQRWLRYEGKPGRILAILDDVWHDAPARELRKLLPPGSCCIVTTRNRQLRLGGKLYELDHLSSSDAWKFLNDRLGDLAETASTAEDLISLLESHPLALEIASAHIIDNGLSYLDTYTSYIEEAMESDSPFGDLEIEYGDSAREKSVEVTLALSYEPLSNDLKSCFRALGIFPSGLDYSESSIFALWNVNIHDIKVLKEKRALLLKLFQLGLIKRDEQNGRYRQHTLIQAFARSLARRVNEYAVTQGRYLWHVTNEIAGQFDVLPFEQWETIIMPEREHIHYVGNSLAYDIGNLIDRRLLNLLVAPQPPFKIPDIPDNLVFLLNAAANFAIKIRDYVGTRHVYEGISWLQLGLISARVFKHEDLQDTFLNAISVWYQSHGDLKAAIAYSEEFLRRAVKTNDSDKEATALNNLGGMYRHLGNLDRALEYLQRALPIKLQSESSSHQVAILNNIGLVYRNRDNVEQALAFFRQALSIATENKLTQARAALLDNIGQCYLSNDALDEAFGYFDQALTIRRDIQDYVGEATTLNNIGFIYAKRSDTRKAVDTLRIAVQKYNEYGALSDEAGVLTNLAVMLQEELGETDEAIECIKRSITILEEFDLPQDSVGSTIGQKQLLLAMWEGGARLRQLPIPRGLPEAEAQEISLIISEFSYAPNWDAFRFIVDRNKESLFKPIAEVVFNAMFDSIPKDTDPRTLDLLQRRWKVIMLCREHGVKAGFERAEIEGIISPPVTEEEQKIANAFWATLRALDMDTVKDIVKHYADVLLKPEADRVIEEIISSPPPGFPDNLLESLKIHHEVLKLCREYGIDEGFRRALDEGYMSSDEVTKMEAITELFWITFNTLPDISSLKIIIEQYSHLLLTPAAEAIIEQIVSNPPEIETSETIQAVKQHQQLLKQCRKIGIEAAFQNLQTKKHSIDEVADNS